MYIIQQKTDIQDRATVNWLLDSGNTQKMTIDWL